MVERGASMYIVAVLLLMLVLPVSLIVVKR